MVIETSQSQADNFHVIASFAALEVLQKDDYFQDLPENWQQLIHKIKEKLSAKAQNARFEEKLSDITSSEKDVPLLPDAIKQLIGALNDTRSQTEIPHSISIAAVNKLSRAYTPCATAAKMPLKKSYRDEELREDRCRNRQRLGPVN